MNRESILTEIRRIMSEVFEIEPENITLQARLVEDLDLDSIDAIDLVVKLEDLAGKRIPEEELKALRTIENILDLVERSL